MKYDIKNLKNNLKKIRKEKGLTQIKLAKLSGISLDCIKSIETGRRNKPYIQTIMKLAMALEVEISNLFI